MESDRDARIRERAYAIWEREGQPHGRHVEHWIQAKAEIAAEEQTASDKARPVGASTAPGAAQPSPPAAQPAIRSEPVRVTRERGGETGESQPPGQAADLEAADAGQRNRRRGRRGGEEQS